MPQRLATKGVVNLMASWPRSLPGPIPMGALPYNVSVALPLHIDEEVIGCVARWWVNTVNVADDRTEHAVDHWIRSGFNKLRMPHTLLCGSPQCGWQVRPSWLPC